MIGDLEIKARTEAKNPYYIVTGCLVRGSSITFPNYLLLSHSVY